EPATDLVGRKVRLRRQPGRRASPGHCVAWVLVTLITTVGGVLVACVNRAPAPPAASDDLAARLRAAEAERDRLQRERDAGWAAQRLRRPAPETPRQPRREREEEEPEAPRRRQPERREEQREQPDEGEQAADSEAPRQEPPKEPARQEARPDPMPPKLCDVS